MKLKSFAITVALAAFVAYTGSFLTVWTLPHQKDPYTFHDMKRGMGKVFSFTDDLRETRTSYRKTNEEIFADRVHSFDGPAER